MENRKLKISEFIESMEGSELASTVLLGGATDSINSTNGGCENSGVSCIDSTNSGCTNYLDKCEKSTNTEKCKNTSLAPKPDNVQICYGFNQTLYNCG